MSNELTIPDNFGPVADVFKDSTVDVSQFTAGIGMAWPILTLKGKSWGWRFRGQDHQYTAPDPAAGNALMPMRVLDVVLVNAGLRISKVYYKEGYQEGQRLPPECWSADGITPDPGANEKQANTCRGCRHNVLRSGTDAKGKACSDNKRLAVVTIGDLKNTDFGGPFMLRLPPGSFSNYTTYVSVMGSRGYQPFAIVTRLMFDPSVSHPKVMFMPVRALTHEEALIIKGHQDNPRTGEMLNDKALAAFADPDAEVEPSAVGALPPAANTNGRGQIIGWEAPPPSTPPVDDLKPPLFLVREGQSGQSGQSAPPAPPALTPAQQEIAALKAKLAEAERAAAEPPPPPPVVLTPEQLEIQQLRAKLAEAEAAKKKPGRPRSKPVAPPEGQAQTPAPAQVTQAGNGVAPPQENPPSAVGNAIADRIAGLVGKTS